MSEWLNNKIIVWTPKEITKPCHTYGMCPYGQLVEEFPLAEKRTEYSCKVFGHDCPAYYHAEWITEESVPGWLEKAQKSAKKIKRAVKKL